MKAITDSLLVAWRCAASEAVRTGFEVIEPEHLLIGLFRMQVFAEPESLLKAGFSQKEAEVASIEIKSVLELFQRYALDPETSRRELRALVARRQPHPESVSTQNIHRSPRSRKVFEGAEILADEAGHSAVGPFHFLVSLLRTDDRPAELLQARGVDIGKMCGEAIEAAAKLVAPESREQGEPRPPSALVRYGKDLTRAATDGYIHQAVGRKDEMLQIVRTLSRETKANPLLIGDPGVGKTSIVEGLAWRLAQGNVPETIRGKRIVQISATDVVAGLEGPGQFEERIRDLVQAANELPDVILFFEEFNLAASILRVAFSGGDLRCIGATTREDYRKYVQADGALERRFQPIYVEEPSPEETMDLLRGLQARFVGRHAVTITESALSAAVQLSVKYLPERRLPDKAIDLLDEACVRARITRLTDVPGQPAGPVRDLDAEVVAEVVSEWTGIPQAQLTEDERKRLLRMGEALRARVVGQEQAVDAVVGAIQRSRARIKDPDRPLAVLLFMGPTGVGKTELAKATAAFLFGSEKAMTRLDMSEFMSGYTVSRLIGAPPGYIGYDKEGQLTGALRKKPFSVVLLDEIEKAHSDVLNLLLQVFDDGRLTDATGRTVNASNSLFIMTSNITPGRDLGFRAAGGDPRKIDLDEPLKASFRPEFINRIDEIVPFRSLDRDHLKKIARVMLGDLDERLAAQDLSLVATDSAIDLLVEAGYDEGYGARPIRRAIEHAVENPLSAMIVRGAVSRGQVVLVEARDGKIDIRAKQQHG